MTLLTTGAEVAFWICAPLMVLFAFGMVFARKAVHSALFLAGLMIMLAVLYASQDAPFLFVVQIIVYTGAIMMLFLFVVMLVGVDTADSFVETLRGHLVATVLASLGLAGLLVTAVVQAVRQEPVGVVFANEEYGGNLQGLASLIFGRYVFAFEATSALLITAAVGAMVLAHGERLRPKLTQADLAKQRIEAYATSGTHPGPLPNSGVFARHNSIDTPALLPDGSVSQESISETLQLRREVLDAETLGAPTAVAFKAIAKPDKEADEE